MRRTNLLFKSVTILLGLSLVMPDRAAAVSPTGAFFRSLLIPGWGQRYAGRPAAARRLLTVELALWGGYLGLHRRATVRQDRALSYAAVHAGARPQGRGKRFHDHLKFYDSVLQYNQHAAYRRGPAAELYPDTPEFFWEWDEAESRALYRDLLNASDEAERQALYVVGAVLVNHVFAAVHAARSAGQAGDTHDDHRFQVSAGPGMPSSSAYGQRGSSGAHIRGVHRF